MSKLNKDVISLILKELYDMRNTLYSCLLVDRTWYEMTVPILWKNPFRFHLKEKAHIIIINVILSYLPEESRVNLRNQGIELINTYQQPLLNYISFWRYLNLAVLEKMIETFVTDTNINQSKIHIIGLEIMNIFNRNTKFYFLCNYSRYNFTSGTELCFSELVYLRCTSTQDSSILAGRLAILNTSIKKLNFDILYFSTHNCGIIKLIEGQKNLNEVKFYNKYLVTLKEYIVRPLEEALIKCADTIQYLKIDWKPVTKLFSHLVNLISLEIHAFCHKNWNHLEKISLPHLKYLKAHYVPSKILASLIENTKGNLIEISIIYDQSDDDEGRLIHAIYQNCPNLNYLKLSLFSENFSEFENLLINCQILNGLEIFCVHDNQINWKILFEILTRSTPISLFKFKFIYSTFNSYLNIDLESLNLFLDNWKDRSSMLLQIFSSGSMLNVEQKQHLLKLEDLLQKYKTKGVIKNYNTNNFGSEDFEWIQCKLHTLYD
ncbi:hypothetical protein RhiirA4_467422 [Rhizophagus irregularis]|uniref:F-box domain-containing protein n=1 Tax=Rhizophagus irregularis TaxID=588596 RepID=A0A2I1GVW8_9GLOM|nr:hypothetical protein RhiirA4_467422 [Rhizophagus irregularis]